MRVPINEGEWVEAASHTVVSDCLPPGQHKKVKQKIGTSHGWNKPVVSKEG